VKEISALARVLYDDFFKRDLLGKIGPGSLAAAAVLETCHLDISQFQILKDWPWFSLVVLLPTLYVLGLGLQIAGELIGVHSASPRPRYFLYFRTKGKWRKTNDDFDKRLQLIKNLARDKWLPDASKQRERFVVLKEASGNMAIATIIVFVCLLKSQLVWWAILSGIIAVVLYSSHILHAKRQAIFEVNTLKDIGSLTQQEADEMLSRI